jgi:hypothetical protein
MMTIKHTLAPWKAPASQFGYVTAIDNYGNPVTVCSARSEADARLIAAAPDMLHALRLMLREHAIHQLSAGNTGDIWPSATLARSILNRLGDE